MNETPLRILHFADLHIGLERYGRIDPTTGLNGRVMDFLRRLSDLINFAVDKHADMVIFDPQTIIDNSTFDDPAQPPAGIRWVIVNGEIAVENGQVMGATSGKVLRRG